MSRGRGRALLLHWPRELGGELLGDARPSRDRELQRDAASGAVVTPSGYQLPAARRRRAGIGPRDGGAGLRVPVPRPRSPGDNREDEPTARIGPEKQPGKKISSWQISATKTKKWSSPCRMERKTALWEGVKATSQQEIIDGDRPADWPLTSDGPYPIGRSMMGWAEMEMIWKCSWRR